MRLKIGKYVNLNNNEIIRIVGYKQGTRIFLYKVKWDNGDLTWHSENFIHYYFRANDILEPQEPCSLKKYM